MCSTSCDAIYENSLFAAYRKISDIGCSPTYGSFSSLTTAEVACTSDSNCQGVADTRCDNSGTFELCPKQSSLQSFSVIFHSGVGSCVYKKGSLKFQMKL